MLNSWHFRARYMNKITISTPVLIVTNCFPARCDELEKCDVKFDKKKVCLVNQLQTIGLQSITQLLLLSKQDKKKG